MRVDNVVMRMCIIGLAEAALLLAIGTVVVVGEMSILDAMMFAGVMVAGTVAILGALRT